MACELDLVLTCSRRRKQLKMISSSLMIPTCFLIISASLLVGSGGMLQILSGIFSDDEILRMNNFLLHAVIRVQEDQDVCIYALFLA
jgi:hypothetical protein